MTQLLETANAIVDAARWPDVAAVPESRFRARVASTASQMLTVVPTSSATATTAVVASVPLLRRANFFSRYAVDGGHAVSLPIG